MLAKITYTLFLSTAICWSLDLHVCFIPAFQAAVFAALSRLQSFTQE